MKAPFAFGIGLASGAIIVAILLLVARSDNPPTKDPVIATLREELLLAQQAAQRDRDELRATLQTIQKSLREAAPARASTIPPDAAASAPSLIPTNAASASSAITTYLGAPVPAPANLDRRYTPEELSAVFRDLMETLGTKVEKLAVDTAEFPFVVHGRLQSSTGAGALKKIDAELRALPGYTYGGSVTGGDRDGSTYFALNMTPSTAYPREHREAINRRLMVRLQAAADASK